MWMDRRMEEALNERRKRGTLRFLQFGDAATITRDEADADPIHRVKSTESLLSPSSHLPIGEEMDFSSNDYLGLAHSLDQATLCHERNTSILATLKQNAAGSASSSYGSEPVLGATGSRLLSGDSPSFHDLERYLAIVHRREAALLFNSGYDANVSVVSSLRCDVLVFDEYVHNSLHMGMRLWQSSAPSTTDTTERVSVSFRHNSSQHLDQILREGRRRHGRPISVVVLIESVYSMDGDVAPVQSILDVCSEHGALLVVDEAHALGVFGRKRDSPPLQPVSSFAGTGVLAQAEVEKHPSLLCSVHTFGKAAGCHGAVVCGSHTLKSYLANYGYPFIYSTALPHHSLVAIRCSYETMTSQKGDELRCSVFRLVGEFRSRLQQGMGDGIVVEGSCDGPSGRIYLLPSSTPIQALMIPGNRRCTEFCLLLYRLSGRRIRLFPIKAPTVPSGQERIRIILHAHNTLSEVRHLVSLILDTLQAMSPLLATRLEKSAEAVRSRL